MCHSKFSVCVLPNVFAIHFFCLKLALIAYHACVSAAHAGGTGEHGCVRARFCLAIGKNMMAIFVSHSL